MRIALALSTLVLIPSAFSYEIRTKKYPDQRLKQVWFPEQERGDAGDPETLARSYLASNHQDFGLSEDLGDLRLVRSQQSLLGYHLSFQQFVAGIPVDKGLVHVSILKDQNQIYQIYNTARPSARMALKQGARLSVEQAYDRAWEHLGVSGELFEAPHSKLILVSDGQGLKPVYRVDLSTTAPYGGWQVDVDAISGSIIRTIDRRVELKPQTKAKPNFGKRAATVARKAAFARFEAAQARKNLSLAEVAEGKGKVFDPDPRTTSGNRNLKDSSPASAFAAEYFERILPEISLRDGAYSLEGPWVKIIDFDPPRTAPSSTPDGNWNFERGSNAFNDAMTYYHLDKSQRYMQELGFKDETGIQFVQIEADTDGVNGDDNSYYMSSSNRLSFGHGCVDDNEDADVILHEYGHAINFSINNNWDGGDTGAMGEGFGDYWAASYSDSTQAGANFFPNEVYTFDGQGSDECWPGRILNASAARYDPRQTYGAHSGIPGGFQSDELWATPLFQAHRALKAQGVPREEIDSIVLQAQFGLGSDITMPEMAQSILTTARLLHPNGPHAQAFLDQFVHHNILSIPTVKLSVSSTGLLNPGDSSALALGFKNSGDLAATGATLLFESDDPNFRVPAESVELGDIAAGATVESILNVDVAADAPCGYLGNIRMIVRDEAGKEYSLPLALRVGSAINLSVRNDEVQAIPDNNTTGISSQINLVGPGQITENLRIPLQIKHPYRADLTVKLRSPKGTTVTLHSKTGSSDDNLIGVYPDSLTPSGSLSAFKGEDQEGVWTLTTTDTAGSDVGELQSWGIEDVKGYACQ